MSERIKDTIIVIGRQFGCGGRETGKALSEALHIPYYDKELLIEAASSTGIEKEILRNCDEHKPSFFRSFPGLMSTFNGDYCHDNLSNDKIYNITANIIKDVASKGGCVIVGRTADYVLRDHPDMLSIFLHAPVEKRAERIVKRGDCDNIEDAKKMAQKRDAHRSNYYNYYTGWKWGSADNYHLSIDASTMTTPALVEFITHYIKHKK